MSLVEEVLAQHKKSSDYTSPVWGHCLECWESGRGTSSTWPCRYVRLATELQNAQAVVEAAREYQAADDELHDPECHKPMKALRTTGARELMREALARYDEGRQE